MLKSVQLRKAQAAPPPPKPLDPRENLLHSIRQGGVTLRKIERPTEKKKQPEEESNVAAILMRRAAMEMSDSSGSEGDEGDEDW
jgi:WAS family protein 2